MNLKQELHTWQEIPLAGNETEPGKIQIFPEFPDPEGLLESAYAFLKRLKALPMKLWTKQRSTEKYEEYFLNLSPGVCVISANDTEGIRRGIYKIAEILREKTPDTFPVEEKKYTPN